MKKDTAPLENTKIAVIALGSAGLPLASELGKKYPVLGFDSNESHAKELKKGKDRTQEFLPLDVEKITDKNTVIFDTKACLYRKLVDGRL